MVTSLPGECIQTIVSFRQKLYSLSPEDCRKAVPYHLHAITRHLHQNAFLLTCGGGGGEGCHLRVVPPGQLPRRPSTPKPFIEVVMFIFEWFSVQILYIFSLYSYLNILYIFSLYLWCLTVLSRIMIALSCLLSMTDPIPSCGGIVGLLIFLYDLFFLCLQWFLFGILELDGMSERNNCHIIICFTSLF